MTNNYSLCVKTRLLFEKMLSASRLDSTAGSCLFASILLQMSLQRFGNCTATIRGGDGEQDGGTLGIDGRWHGQYWVELVAAFVADITGDQFGHDRIVFLPIATARVKYLPGRQAPVDVAVQDLLVDLAENSQLACA